MIRPEIFISHLTSCGFRFYTGVPCSYFKDVIRYIEAQSHLTYIIAPNEGAALAMASGSYLAEKPSVVMIQNSGLGNMVNPLTSLNAIYQIPVLIFVSGRAYGIPDEPQHEIIGKRMLHLLKALEIPFWELPQEENKLNGMLDFGIATMRRMKKPVVYIINKGTFTAYDALPKPNVSQRYSMKRIDALSIIRKAIPSDHLIFATTGKPSRELFFLGDRPGNFYMQGSMGHVGALALGMALSRPAHRVVVLDGDGAFLMHMGILSSIGHYGPANLIHLVIDNESYETTGDQETTASSTDFEGIAKACGYRTTTRVETADALQRTLPSFLQSVGPALLRIKVNREETKDIPRITTRYTASEISESVKRFIATSGVSSK